MPLEAPVTTASGRVVEVPVSIMVSPRSRFPAHRSIAWRPAEARTARDTAAQLDATDRGRPCEKAPGVSAIPARPAACGGVRLACENLWRRLLETGRGPLERLE